MKILSQINENDDAATKEYVDTKVAANNADNVITQTLVSTVLNEKYVKEADVVDLFYPVGTIVLSLDTSFNPNTAYTGTTWTRIADGIFLESSSTPNVEKQAGLPDITGIINEGNGAEPVSSASGAFYGTSTTVTAPASGSSTGGVRSVSFAASRANSIYGNSTTVQPHSLTVIMWKRTA